MEVRGRRLRQFAMRSCRWSRGMSWATAATGSVCPGKELRAHAVPIGIGGVLSWTFRQSAMTARMQHRLKAAAWGALAGQSDFALQLSFASLSNNGSVPVGFATAEGAHRMFAEEAANP